MSCAKSTESSETNPASTLAFTAPARNWVEALPIGNGHQGAMVFGGVSQERLQFNEKTLWTGGSGTREMGSYQPFGDCYIDFNPGGAPNDCDGYSRTLSLSEAIARSTFQSPLPVEREAFASYPARVIAYRAATTGPRTFSCTVRLVDVRSAPVRRSGTTLVCTGVLSNGLRYVAAARVVCVGGDVVSGDLYGGGTAQSGASLLVQDSPEVVVLLSLGTDFSANPVTGWRGEDPLPAVLARLDDAERKGYANLRAEHLADHQALFNRVTLELGTAPLSRQPLAERLAGFAGGEADPALPTLLFNYGRYLLIASSRPGTLPANLQGVWNAELVPAWWCGYTTNINLQMNYWLSEPAALGELAEPYYSWVESIATVQKTNPDPRLHTTRGWIAYSTMNPFGGSTGWAIHLPGSAWLARQFIEHWRYRKDAGFLRTRTYPMLAELCDFWLEHLVAGAGGTLVTPDGWSPEHGPGKKEGDRTPRPGVSYDQQIVGDLFDNYLEAAEALGVKDERYRNVEEARGRLLGPRVGSWGQLQEWMEDLDDPTDTHRHVSHLYALHPGTHISPATTPALATAASVSLDARGDGGTGWSRAWKCCFRARLHQGDKAEQVLRGLLAPVLPAAHDGGSYPNLFGAHPPFQIDSNFGATAAVCEMLVQSHRRSAQGRVVVELLPALPTSWKMGSYSGLRVQGGCAVDAQWRDGVLLTATLSVISTHALENTHGLEIVVEYRGQQRALSVGRETPAKLAWSPAGWVG